MDTMFTPEELKRVSEGRESYSARLLTDRQFDTAMAITGVVERDIQESGRFKRSLDQWSSAFAGTESFDIARANSTLRDLFKIRTGLSMNEMRETLVKNEEKLFDRETNPAEAELQKAYVAANEVGRMVQDGDKMTFTRAFAFEASQLATDLNITDWGAKNLIVEAFKETENRDFREWGKELDQKFFDPQIAAEKEQRHQEKSYSRSRQPSYS